jgi:hypothetical protein
MRSCFLLFCLIASLAAFAPAAEIILTAADSPDGREAGVNFVGLLVVME